MLEVNSLPEFQNAWNGIESGADDVMILSHSRSHALIFAEGSSEDAISVDGFNLAEKPIGNIHNLSPKDIKSLSLLSCNAGHLDVANADKENVAQAFASLGGIGKVIAYDGNVGYGVGEDVVNNITESYGFSLPESKLFPRKSVKQGEYYDTLKQNVRESIIDGTLWKDMEKSIENDTFRLFPQGQIVYYPDGTYEVLNKW